MKTFSSFLLMTALSFFVAVTVPAQKSPIAEAVEKMERNDPSGALDILNKIIEKTPENFSAYQLRSEVRFMKSDVKGAADDLSTALELKPNASDLYMRRARYRMMLRDFDGAMSDFNSALDKGVSSEKVFLERAGLKRILKDKDGALKDYQMAISIRPHLAAANLGLAGLLEANGDTPGAIAHLENFLSGIEKDWNNQFPITRIPPLGEAKLLPPVKPASASDGAAGGQFIGGTTGSFTVNSKQEVAELEQMSNLSLAYSTLASLYEKTGNFEKAVISINKAFSLVRGGGVSFSSYDTRGRIRLRLKDYEGAVQDFSTAIRGIPFNPPYYLNRGVAYFCWGKEAEAQRDFDKFISMYAGAKAVLEKRLEEIKKETGK